ncbi:MAG: NYN domain-containing protein [Candidatus Omnitrophica bacterium CG12_big_fil_rev_8_21_14_0_65_42_8]|nr:MAG: NYN domain-containing protein [Candidatus Omnitrophica bacterium CG12_big_fil_rev_8_21_14_0_65_42_8]
MAEIKKERVAIFIDGSNFYHGLKTCIGNTKVDFSKFSQLLCGSRELVRAYYYNAPVNQQAFPDIYKDQQKFFGSLKTVPYFVLKLGRLEKRTVKVDKENLIKTFGDDVAKLILEKWGEVITTYVEKGVDIDLAADMLRLAYNNAYDTAIIVTGDGDFVSAVNGVKDMGKHVENANFSDGKGYHIRTACDKFISLDKDFLKPCLKKQ